MSQMSNNRIITVTSQLNKYVLCCQETDHTLIIRVTDGKSVWRHEDKTNKDEIQWKKLNTDLKVSKCKDTLNISSSDGKLLWSLTAAFEDEQVNELKDLIFFLADQTFDLQTRLSQMPDQSPIKRNPNYSLTDLESHRKKLPVKTRPKDGMSIINPMAKRLKPSQGITFD